MSLRNGELSRDVYSHVSGTPQAGHMIKLGIFRSS